MNGKRKNYLENTIIITVLGSIVYGISNFIFSTTTISTPISTIAKYEIPVIKQIITPEIVNAIKTIVKIPEIIEPEAEITEPEPEIEELVQVEIPKQIQKEVKQISSNKTESIQYDTQEQKNETNAFLRATRVKINNNIEQELAEVDTTGYLSIRVTILKDGDFEQLTYMGGNKNHFKLVENSIKDIFPVNISENIKYQFPRYFRMRINY